MRRAITVAEWDNDKFHQRVLQLEAEGFITRLETYSITAEMDPDTGEIFHLCAIEMYKPEEEEK